MAKVHQSITAERIRTAVEADEYRGFCLACGTEVDEVEPDTRAAECDDCGAHRVYGAEELLLILVA